MHSGQDRQQVLYVYIMYVFPSRFWNAISRQAHLLKIAFCYTNIDVYVELRIVAGIVSKCCMYLYMYVFPSRKFIWREALLCTMCIPSMYNHNNMHFYFTRNA